MSFTQIEPAPVRLNRSQLFILPTDPSSIDAAAKSDADVVFFELEDAIPPGQKAQARTNVLEALNDIDWGAKSVSMRISGLDTPYMYRDLVDVLEKKKDQMDLLK